MQDTIKFIHTAIATGGVILLTSSTIYAKNLLKKKLRIKNSEREDNIKIDNIPDCLKLFDQKSDFASLNPQVKDALNEYIQTMIMSSIDPGALYVNFNKDKIFIKKARFFETCRYDPTDKSIVVSSLNLRENILKCLLLSSSTYETLDNILCGFQIIKKDCGQNLGIGLTTGYRDYLYKNLFDRKETSNILADISYYLERLLDKNVMRELFFRGDLHGLIEALSKYSSRENIIEIVRKIDYIYASFYTKKSTLLASTARKIYEDIVMSIADMMIKKSIVEDLTQNKREVLQDMMNLLFKEYRYSKINLSFPQNKISEVLSNLKRSLELSHKKAKTIHSN